MTESAHGASADIAVIGYAARFPGAPDVAQFWRNLSRGVESIRHFTVEELASVGVSAAALADPDYVRAGAPLSQLDAFDAAFFGISPREAAIMDPQQRFFLETTWEALEHAGHAPGTFKGSIGLFAGSGPNSYLIHNLLSDPELVRKEGIFLLRHTGNDKDVLATRASYQMNLRGPSVNIQTACSTSLVAVHFACQSLLGYGCDLALAGAVSIEVPHAIGYGYRQNEIQSHDGHCRAFDANSTGTVFGSGIGVVVLRRLADALAAGDTIHAVIKGTAVNNDGSRKIGFLAPSAEGQVEVISEALAAAGIEPATVDYIETHGTGTPIGDPIELSALAQVYGDRPHELKIGSVKTNIGHLDTAAGMAGLLKAVLALEHRLIPPTLHFRHLNPLIDAKANFHVVSAPTAWETGAHPRRAGVTSLGIGGTNAHVVLEEATAARPSRRRRTSRLFTLSAKSPAALDDATRALAAHLRQASPDDLADISHTLHVGRAAFPHRRSFVARDQAEAVALAGQPAAPGVVTGRKSDAHSITFLFPGQGAQYCRMAAELYRTEPVFQRWLDDCAELATPHLGHDFRTILFPDDAGLAHARDEIRLTWNAQPILFAVEYALAQLWISWGIVPDRLLGHSLGEYPAACLSGVFSVEDAVAIVCARGNLMKKIADGAMLAVALSEAEIAARLTGGIGLAAINSPGQCVLSGPAKAIAALHDQLKQEGVAVHRLETSHAFHSTTVEPIMAAFEEVVRSKQLHPPRIPLVTNVTGQLLRDEEATDPRFWVRHMRETVRFADGLATLAHEPGAFFVEIGPGETLTALGRQAAGKEARERFLPSLPRVSDTNGDHGTLLAALGRLWVNGVAVDWEAFYEHEQLRRVPLPTYPFQRKRFWMGPKIGTNWLADATAPIEDWFQQVNWRPTPLPPPSASNGPWLVLGDDSPDFSRVIDTLRAKDGTVVSVVAGAAYAKRGDDSYTVNPAAPDDFAALVRDIAARRVLPRHVVHLWALRPDADEDRCFHSLVFLLQALGNHAPEQNVTLLACSHRSVALSDEPVLHPRGSLLAGPCRVAPLEYPAVRARQIDVGATDAAALADLILREADIPGASTDGALVIHRDGQRWAQAIERSLPEATPSPLRPRATYLITGGLGGLGFAVADWLARTHAARVVLLSRTGRPSEEQQAQFEEWRKLGAEVLVVAGDVTDRASLDRALAVAREKFGPLHGIFHAAGELRDGLIALKKKEDAQRVLAPKVAGLENLDAATRDVPLDFFALFSSVSAIAPPDGQVDYAAANAFLESYARSRAGERRFLVLGWGPWSQVGMVAPKSASAGEPFRHPLLDRVELDTGARTIYSGTLSVERHWVLAEHRFHGGDALLPGTANLEIVASALWAKLGRRPVQLENVVFVAPLRVAPHVPVVVHAELQRNDDAFQFSVTANDRLFASGQAHAITATAPKLDLRAIAARCPQEKIAPPNTRQRGHFDFGPRWQSLRTIAFGRDECLATVELPAEFRAEADEFALHPALFDIATGVAMYLVPGYEKAGDILLPFAYQRLTVFQRLPAHVVCHARLRSHADSDLLVFDLTLATETGDVVAEVEEFTVKRLRSVADVSQLENTDGRGHAGNGATAVRPRGIATREGIAALDRALACHADRTLYISPVPIVPLTPRADTPAPAPVAGSSTASDDVEQVLVGLWQSLLGLDHADASTDFFDAGGHSLLAVRLFTEIRKRFEVNFGLSTLFEARTVGTLAELIRRSRSTEPAARSAGPAIVPIRAGGDAKVPPLFLIHDVGGSVLRYEQLARHFPKHQPIFAVESRGLSGQPVDYSVREMARHYVAQIRERQPEGPYYLAGHSFGGLVAYEIARLLAAQGATLGLVGLLDTFQRPITREDAEFETGPLRNDRLPFLRRVVKDFRTQLLSRDRIGYLKERSSAVRAWLTKTTYRTAYRWSQKLGTDMPASLRDVKEANWIAADYYLPEAYEGTIVLFRCLNRLDTDPPDSSHIWRRLARGGVTVHEVPGDHNSMLREPGVAILAEQILAHLPKAAETKT
jgi:acyl transferase domain-containing protein/thioesterase domain-containing protein/acyl carrier protein